MDTAPQGAARPAAGLVLPGAGLCAAPARRRFDDGVVDVDRLRPGSGPARVFDVLEAATRRGGRASADVAGGEVAAAAVPGLRVSAPARGGSRAGARAEVRSRGRWRQAMACRGRYPGAAVGVRQAGARAV